MANFSTIKNFSSDEFENPAAMDQDLINKLDELRTKFGRPIKINSSYRSCSHNAEVSGVSDSQHLTGHAVDVAVEPGSYIYDLVGKAVMVGFTGIGVNKKTGEEGFVHLDNRPYIDRAMWTY